VRQNPTPGSRAADSADLAMNRKHGARDLVCVDSLPSVRPEIDVDTNWSYAMEPIVVGSSTRTDQQGDQSQIVGMFGVCHDSNLSCSRWSTAHARMNRSRSNPPRLPV
jgi:hypothetical protein